MSPLTLLGTNVLAVMDRAVAGAQTSPEKQVFVAKS